MINPVKAVALMGSGRGRGDIKPADVAHALGGDRVHLTRDNMWEEVNRGLARTGLSRAAYLLAAVKWADDHYLYDVLCLAVYRHTQSEAISNNWRIPKGKERCRALSNLAVFEILNGPKCTNCKGDGQITVMVKDKNGKDKADEIACPECLGKGSVDLSERKRAQWSGIDWHRWHEIWGARYQKNIFPWILDRQNEAFSYIKARLRE